MKLRILHTNFLKHWGGESQRIWRKVQYLSRRGHYVALASPANAVITKMVRDVGLPVCDQVSFGKRWSLNRDIHDVQVLRKFIQEEKIQILHTHGSKDAWLGGLAAQLTPGVIMVRTRHNIFPVRRHPGNRWLYRGLSDQVIAISEYIRHSLTVDGFLPPERVHLIHTGIEVNHYCPGNGRPSSAHKNHDRIHVRREFGIPQDKPLVGTVAHLAPHKGHRYFMEAAALALQADPDIYFLIVGSGGGRYPKELKELAHKLSLGSRLIFAGSRSDIPAILCALDVFVNPSLKEGLGIATLEALAMARPVVGTAVGGIPESVRDGETGLLVPPADPMAMAGAILKLLSDRDLGRRLGHAGRLLVEKEFSAQTMVDRVESLYYSLLGLQG